LIFKKNDETKASQEKDNREEGEKTTSQAKESEEGEEGEEGEEHFDVEDNYNPSSSET
jgi:hypothetical protein